MGTWVLNFYLFLASIVTFLTDSESALNQPFFDTHIDFYCIFKVLLSILALFETLKTNPPKRLKKGFFL